MKTMTALAMGALMTMLTACGDGSGEEQGWTRTFLIQQCSPVDPHCQLAEPPSLNDRPTLVEQ
jgi:hypothetical protein